ncbi:MAG: acyl-CoA dehydrogenase [Gammaproteobacteria bacterium]|nr:acyl-CoA dehydrogenase [Gammaproteobacteria bacterium]
MALVLNEEQQLLRDSAKTFLQECSPVGSLRALRDAGEEWSPALWTDMAEMGWPGIVIPQEYDGLEFGYVGAGLLFEECGRTLASSPLLSSALVCSSIVAALGNDDQKQAVLPAIVSGEMILSLALNDTNRFDPSATALLAVADGDGFVLSGKKVHVLDGNIAHNLLVVARTGGVPGEEDGLSVFLIGRDCEGLTFSNQRNVDNRLATDIQFDGVRVGPESLLGEAGKAWQVLEKALDIGAVCSSSEMLGIAEESFERTIQYLKERKQFGVLIGSFQALQHRAALMFCELDLCRSVVLKALQAIDENSADRSLLASVAKVKCGRTVKLAVNEAVQMHAGIGMTDEFDIGFFMKRSAAACTEYGDDYYHSDRFARLRGY